MQRAYPITIFLLTLIPYAHSMLRIPRSLPRFHSVTTRPVIIFLRDEAILQRQLRLAIGRGHTNLASLAIKRGAEICGRGYLHLAVETGNVDIAHLLIEHGASLEERNGIHETPLFKAVDSDKVSGMVKFLIAKKANIGDRNLLYETPLISAAYNGAINNVKILLDAGADVNAKAYRGNTALISAASRGTTQLTQLLIDCGAEMNHVNNDGESALLRAVAANNINCASLLLSQGAYTDCTDFNGYSAYDIAMDMLRRKMSDEKHLKPADYKSNREETKRLIQLISKLG